MYVVTYSDLAERFGDELAYRVLECMEVVGDLESVQLDLEIRFKRAFERLCEIDFSETPLSQEIG